MIKLRWIGIISTVIAVGMMRLSPIIQAEQVDLSPLPTLSTSSDTESASNPISSETSSEAQTASTTGDTTRAVTMEQPSDLVAYLAQETTPSALTLTVFESIQQENVKGATYSVAKAGDLRYLTMTRSGKVPLSVLMQLEQQQVKQVWQSTDDLMTSAANLMQSQADALQETVVAQLVAYTNEHSTDLIGKYIALTDRSEATATYQTTVQWQAYFQAVLSEWLASHPTPTKQENQQVHYELTGDLAQQFTEVMRRHEADFPALKTDFERFKDQYDGTIVFDLAEKQIAIGLIEEGTALEYYLRSKEVPMELPKSEQVLTWEQFNQQVGFDWLQGVQKVETQLP